MWLAGTPIRGALRRLEPCEGKLSRTDLRGEGARKGPALPGAGGNMKILTAAMLLVALAGCATSFTPKESVSRIRVGMTEQEVRHILKPHTVDAGTVQLDMGGSGVRDVHFQISDSEQICIRMSGGPPSVDKVTSVGRIEPKRKWTKLLTGDDMHVESSPTG
jgi:hypothetical protein